MADVIKGKCVCVSCGKNARGIAFQIIRVKRTQNGNAIFKTFFWKRIKTALICIKCYDRYIDSGYRTGVRD